MAQQKANKQVTAIVPAYNEAPRIAAVLEVLTTYPHFREVIVIDDGSTDATGNIAQKFDVRYVRNETNKGKGQAMDQGVTMAKSDVLFFCDADTIGLTHDIIDEIVSPVVTGETDMFIGMGNRKWYIAHYIVTLIPLLGGERALTKALWQKVPKYYKQYFRIEAGLNFFALYYAEGFQYKVFKNLSQVVKEKKYGFWDGMQKRWGMIFNIIFAQLKLHFVHIPESAKNKRLLAVFALQSIVGMAIGALVLAAVYYGPTAFVTALFSEELLADTFNPFVDFLLYFTNVTTVGTLIVIGFVVVLANMLVFLLTFRELGNLFYGLKYKLANNKTPPHS